MGCFDDDKSQQGGGGDNDSGHDEGEIITDNNALDPLDRQQQAQRDASWATAGYTPLTDFSATLLVSMGPHESSSSESDNDGNVNDNDNDGGEGTRRIGAGEFFVNPSPFMSSNNDDHESEEEEFENLNNDVESIEESKSISSVNILEANFESLASKALLALEEEYERTLRGERRPGRWQQPLGSRQHEQQQRQNVDLNATGEIEINVASSKDNICKKCDDDDEYKDLKVIAAAFDERKLELEQQKKKSKEEGSFVADWDSLGSTGNVVKTSKQPKPPSSTATTTTDTTIANVDTDAVRKAVQELSKKKDAPFQQKFSAWQRRQQQQTLHSTANSAKGHELIPLTPWKAFQRSSLKAKQASASISRSATLAEALIRLHHENIVPLYFSNSTSSSSSTPSQTTAVTTVGENDKQGCNNIIGNRENGDFSLSSSSLSLVIHVVGVDHVECESIQRVQSTFRPIVRWLGAYYANQQKQLQGTTKTQPCFQNIQFHLIGRDLNVPHVETGINLLTEEQNDSNTTNPISQFHSATATCHSGVYHEWRSQYELLLTETVTPHIIIAYNAGIWGYKEWEPTIQYLMHDSICPKQSTTTTPMIITAYTMEECREDFEIIHRLVVQQQQQDNNSSGPRPNCESNKGKSRRLWEPELNPFGSKMIRETKSSGNEYRENSYWQAWCL